MRIDLIISATVHAALLLWFGLSFSTQQLKAAAPDSLPVDIISDTQFSQLTKGVKNAPKTQTPKPLADKVDEAKPASEAVDKVVEKPEIKPLTADPEPQKQPETKPVEAKPEKTPEKAKPDPIVEAMKKEEAKKAAEAKAKAKAAVTKQQPKFNPDQIAEMLDKREAQRQASADDVLNKEPTLGAPTGSAPLLSQSEIDALRSRLMNLWNPPAGVLNPQELIVKVRIKLGRDGKLVSPPMVLTSGRGSNFEAARDGAVRAIFQGQPFEMLKPEHYDLWKELEITFDPRELSPG
jgi:outer membrane biosynthesis protein TonB